MRRIRGGPPRLDRLGTDRTHTHEPGRHGVYRSVGLGLGNKETDRIWKICVVRI
jgi:hypothetical protein